MATNAPALAEPSATHVLAAGFSLPIQRLVRTTLVTASFGLYITLVSAKVFHGEDAWPFGAQRCGSLNALSLVVLPVLPAAVTVAYQFMHISNPGRESALGTLLAAS